MLHTSRRFISWLAILAMALNALWPLLAQAEPAQGDGAVIEVCTPTGMQWIAVAGRDQAPAQHGSALRHCGYCMLGAGHASVPSAYTLAPVPVPVAVALVAIGDFAAVVARSCFSPASPRAPPLLS